jgi:hypothetical protein
MEKHGKVVEESRKALRKKATKEKVQSSNG